MSEKRAKKIRRISRAQYEFHVRAWESRKPSRWRIFRYLKWKKQKPTYEHIEKRVKSMAKGRC